MTPTVDPKPWLAGGILVAAGAALFLGTPWSPALEISGVADRVSEFSHECEVAMDDGSTASLSASEAKAAMGAIAGTEASTESVEGVPAQVLDQISAGAGSQPGPVLHCDYPAAQSLPEQTMTSTGLTPRAQSVLDQTTAAFGAQSVGGFAPGGVETGHGAESTHYEGRAIDVFFRPVTDDNQRQGWLMAQWLVAHADEFDLQYVIYDDLYWGVSGSQRGWRPYDAPQPATPVLRHLDHIHIDVPRGS